MVGQRASEWGTENSHEGMTRDVVVAVGSDLRFVARMEEERCPRTCEVFSRALPLVAQLIQARWSGEAAWVPLGGSTLEGAGVPLENPTSHPASGQLLLYPGGLSEPELLFPYGATTFSSKVGQLAGNPFLTLVEGREHLDELGRRVLWDGAQQISFSCRR